MKEKVETFFLSLASLFRSRFERTESREKKFCFSFWLSDPDSLSPSISLCESQRGGFLQCILTFPILPTLLHVKNVWMCGGGGKHQARMMCWGVLALVWVWVRMYVSNNVLHIFDFVHPMINSFF